LLTGTIRWRAKSEALAPETRRVPLETDQFELAHANDTEHLRAKKIRKRTVRKLLRDAGGLVSSEQDKVFLDTLQIIEANICSDLDVEFLVSLKG
jgi:hypothetical protein